MTIFGSRDPWEIAESIPDEYEPGQSGAFGILKQKPFPALTDEHNPILAAFRRSFVSRTRADVTHQWAHWWVASLDAFYAFGGFKEWDSPSNYAHAITLATPDQIAHARRVLTRLAGWQR